MATKHQIITIRTLLSKQGIDEQGKEDMVSNHTGGRTVSLREMTEDEADLLQQLLFHLQNTGSKLVPENDKDNQMRRKIISKYREMNYNVWDENKNAMVADMGAIQIHLQQNFKKKLNDYTSNELADIISVLDKKFLPWFYKNKASK